MIKLLTAIILFFIFSAEYKKTEKKIVKLLIAVLLLFFFFALLSHSKFGISEIKLLAAIFASLIVFAFYKKSKKKTTKILVGAVLLLFPVAFLFYAEVKTYEYRKATERSGAVSYIFAGDEKPKLNLRSLNKALKTIGLSSVGQIPREQSEISGSRYDRAEYHWQNYSKGYLIVERSLCGRVSSERYDCIWKITVRKK